ncbi:hypothetical protein N9C96_02685 [bacterium]|nr:hypothetical protein [bacterium]
MSALLGGLAAVGQTERTIEARLGLECGAVPVFDYNLRNNLEAARD